MRKFDAWLERLFQERRFLFYLLSVGTAVVILGIAVLVEEILKWLTR